MTKREITLAQMRSDLNEQYARVTLAYQIWNLRHLRKLTREGLADAAGITKRQVYNWEMGKGGSLASLKAMAKVFDVGLFVRFGAWSELSGTRRESK